MQLREVSSWSNKQGGRVPYEACNIIQWYKSLRVLGYAFLSYVDVMKGFCITFLFVRLCCNLCGSSKTGCGNSVDMKVVSGSNCSRTVHLVCLGLAVSYLATQSVATPLHIR